MNSATLGPLRRLGNDALAGLSRALGEVASIYGGEAGVSARSSHDSQPASASHAANTYAEKRKHLLVSGETEAYGLKKYAAFRYVAIAQRASAHDRESFGQGPS